MYLHGGAFLGGQSFVTRSQVKLYPCDVASRWQIEGGIDQDFLSLRFVQNRRST